MADACLFCRIHRREVPAAAVYEDAQVFAFRDLRPQAPTHVVVIPKTHIDRVAALTQDTAPLMGHLVLAANHVARQEGLDTSGYRLVINCGHDGGQTVLHLHLHVLGGRALAWPPG